MRVRVLGPLELHDDGQPIALGPPRQTTVLALLLTRANTTVPLDQLVDELWADRPPASAAANLRTYAANLRRLLAARPGAPVIVTRHLGYRLDVEPAELDLDSFRRLTTAGRTALRSGRPEAAAKQLDEALALWRGEALAGVRAGPRLAEWRTAVTEERLSALENRAEALLGSGAYGLATACARELLSADPLREHAHALLMRARYQAGDAAGALDGFDLVRRLLAERLGAEPGDELRLLRQAVLECRDLAETGSRHVVAGPPAPSAAAVPRQLPADLNTFTGRSEPLRRLDGWLPSAGAVVISGMAGVGKTTLAVHWARHVAGRFPDGQLYVNLRGFDTPGNARTPGDVLPVFLEALGIRPERHPDNLDAQRDLYRSLLTGRRMLVLLDNARDAEHIRPLLPGTPGCLAVVTSRDQLTGLVAVDNAYPLPLGLLTSDESVRLLAARLGPDRLAREPDAAAELVRLSAGLPLALAIVAARAATHTGFTLADLATELHTVHEGLDAFDTGEPTADLRAVFSWSYQTLDPETARLFRLLGLHPGPDFAAPATASLLGCTTARAERLLSNLTRTHLLVEHQPGRYAFHDLLRIYAVELATCHDNEAASRRLLDHYLHSAYAADRLLSPHSTPIEPSGSAGLPVDVTVCRPGSPAEAFDWFQAEHSVLLAVIEQADDASVWRLAWAVSVFQVRRGHWSDELRVQLAAVAAARRTGDPLAQAQANRLLASAYSLRGQWTEAHRHYVEALRWFVRLDDRAGEAQTHRNVSWLLGQQDRYAEALEHDLRALELFQACGQRGGQARALNAVGWDYAQLGDHRQAISHCEQAVALNQQLGDQHGVAVTLDSLGYAHHQLGDLDRAIDCFERAAELIQGAGDRANAAEIYEHLGDSHHAAGSVPAAASAWRLALDALGELDHPSEERIRAKLRRASTLR